MIQKLNSTVGTLPSFKILYDGMIYQRQAAGGINRYFEKLISYLPDDITPLMTLSKLRDTNFPENDNMRLYVRRFQLPKPFRKIGRAVQAMRFENVRRNLRPDLVHATYYDTLGGCEKTKDGPPLVVTVHDMTHEKFPRLLDRSGKHAILKRRAIQRADAIICVSHRTRDDLLERFPECESRTSVIYHATELGSIQPDDWKPESDRPYFLYVGSRSTYKNFDRLLKAFHTIVATNPDVQLRAVGAPFTKSEQTQLAALGLEDRVLNEGFVKDRRLATLYRLSAGLVYPSLYEGFGLPLLEAMSCDTPVLAANCSCIPEVVQDAALLFDPNSESQLAEGLRSLLNDSPQRDSLVRKGRQRCQDFSWGKSARQTVRVYESALAASRIKIGHRMSTIPETTFAAGLGPQFAWPLAMQRSVGGQRSF